MKMITEFETMLPLRKITLVEFERRLKKLVNPTMEDFVSVRMVIECFKDHWAFGEIEEENSLARQLMFDDLFLDSNDDTITELENKMVYIPHLMLLGTLYCCSNKQQKAEKFYELVEIELTDSILMNDKEFRDYTPVLYEISYKLMLRLYENHRDLSPPPDGEEPK